MSTSVHHLGAGAATIWEAPSDIWVPSALPIWSHHLSGTSVLRNLGVAIAIGAISEPPPCVLCGSRHRHWSHLRVATLCSAESVRHSVLRHPPLNPLHGFKSVCIRTHRRQCLDLGTSLNAVLISCGFVLVVLIGRAPMKMSFL
jgi:hypothetical protein